jgi:hypothetical protein
LDKILLGLLLTMGWIFASNYTKEDRINDMAKLTEAVNKIQNGFFYNSYNRVSKGVKQLVTTIEHILRHQLKSLKRKTQ